MARTKHQAPPDKYAAGWLDQLDGRTGIAQAMRHRYSAMSNDLGGHDRLSYAKRAMIERALWLEYYLHTQERALAESRPDFDPGKYTQSVNALTGLLKTLGLERVAHDTGTLHDYLAAKEGSR